MKFGTAKSNDAHEKGKRATEDQRSNRTDWVKGAVGWKATTSWEIPSTSRTTARKKKLLKEGIQEEPQKHAQGNKNGQNRKLVGRRRAEGLQRRLGPP